MLTSCTDDARDLDSQTGSLTEIPDKTAKPNPSDGSNGRNALEQDRAGRPGARRGPPRGRASGEFGALSTALPRGVGGRC